MMVSNMRSGKKVGKNWMFKAALLVALCAVPGLVLAAGPVADLSSGAKAKAVHNPSVKSVQPKSAHTKRMPVAAAKADSPAKAAATKMVSPAKASTPKVEAAPKATMPKSVTSRKTAVTKSQLSATTATTNTESSTKETMPKMEAAPKAPTPKVEASPQAPKPKVEASPKTTVPTPNVTKSSSTLSDQISSLKQEVAQAKAAQDVSSKVTKKKNKRRVH